MPEDPARTCGLRGRRSACPARRWPAGSACPPTTLNQWERDERAPPYDVLEPWGLVVGRSVQVVISETGSRMDDPISPELRDLLKAALDPRLTPDDCVTLAAQMRAYVAARASRSGG